VLPARNWICFAHFCLWGAADRPDWARFTRLAPWERRSPDRHRGGNWLRFAHSPPGRPPAPILGRPGRIGFVLHNRRASRILLAPSHPAPAEIGFVLRHRPSRARRLPDVPSCPSLALFCTIHRPWRPVELASFCTIVPASLDAQAFSRRGDWVRFSLRTSNLTLQTSSELALFFRRPLPVQFTITPFPQSAYPAFSR